MRELTREHKNSIFQDNDGRWKTNIPTYPKRTLIACKEKDRLIDKINNFYKTGVHMTIRGEEKLSKENYEYKEEIRLHKKHKSLKHEEFVYFISDGEFVKIGKANNVLRRMSELQTGNARKLVLLMSIKVSDSFKAENKLHKLFERSNVNNEWFNINVINDFDRISIFEIIEEFNPILEVSNI